MKEYLLTREQIVKAPIEKVWAFFSDPENLNELTPSNMGFEITTPRPLAKMFQGQIIEYKVRPILNIPLYWKTEIIDVDPGSSFIDNQVKGPYSLWHHTHTFKAKDTKFTLMGDTVRYALPMGFVGRIAHSLYVKKRLAEIFDFDI